MTKLKLCGLARICDIEAANRLNPEYIGFVFAKKSRRYVDPAQARELRARLNKGISPVGVFVNESPEAMLSSCMVPKTKTFSESCGSLFPVPLSKPSP